MTETAETTGWSKVLAEDIDWTRKSMERDYQIQDALELMVPKGLPIGVAIINAAKRSFLLNDMTTRRIFREAVKAIKAKYQNNSDFEGWIKQTQPTEGWRMLCCLHGHVAIAGFKIETGEDLTKDPQFGFLMRVIAELPSALNLLADYHDEASLDIAFGEWHDAATKFFEQQVSYVEDVGKGGLPTLAVGNIIKSAPLHSNMIMTFSRMLRGFGDSYLNSLKEMESQLQKTPLVHLHDDEGTGMGPSIGYLWENEVVKVKLYILEAASKQSFTTIANKAAITPSTITDFIYSTLPRYSMSDTSLNKAIGAVTAELNDWQKGVLEKAFEIIDDTSWLDDTMDYLTIGDKMEEAYKTLSQRQEALEKTARDTNQLYDFEQSTALQWLRYGIAKIETKGRGTFDLEILSYKGGRGIVGKVPRIGETPTPALWDSEGNNVVQVGASGIISINTSATATVLKKVMIRGEVKAGFDAEAIEWPEDQWEEFRIDESKWSEGYFALKVIGDSMDRVFAEGSILICEPHNELNGNLQALVKEKEDSKKPLYVIVDRTSSNTDKVESTCKRLSAKWDSEERNHVLYYRLHPESTNDQYSVMVLEDDGENSATLRAIVKSAHIDL